jgi:hypothetical protein
MTRAVWLGLLACTSACLEPTEDFVDPREGLLVEWLPEGGERVTDRSGHGRDLEVMGAVLEDSPPRLVFDGVDDVGVGPDLADLVTTLEAITLEARVRVIDTSSDWSPRSVLSLPQSSASGNYGLGLTVYTAGRRVEFTVVAGDQYVAVSRDELYADEWITVHGVYDGELATLYIDGEAPVDPVPASGMLDAHDFAYGEQPLLVGAYYQSQDRLAFELAEVRIWGRGLPPAEVRHRHAQLVP